MVGSLVENELTGLLKSGGGEGVFFFLQQYFGSIYEITNFKKKFFNVLPCIE